MVDAVCASPDQAPRQLPRRMRRLFASPQVLAAGLVLGITTSIRIAGPYAGIIVMLYAIYKSWKKSILILVPYTAVALLAAYLTWPYLWGDVVNRFVHGVSIMANFSFSTPFLFRGHLVSPGSLPKYYLPFMMSIQLTETVVLLFIFGSFISAWSLVKDHRVEPFSILVLWLLIPFLVVVINKSVIYDNFRQFLFLLPPIFIAGGIGLETIIQRIKRNTLKALVLCALVLPGVFADFNLHPYQYVYYNSFVGGVRGAYNNYEMDYWLTSYREAALYINAVAPQNARIVVLGLPDLFQAFSRSDLKIIQAQDIRSDTAYNFIVADTRLDQSFCETANPVKTFGRDGAIFSIIRIPPASINACH